MISPRPTLIKMASSFIHSSSFLPMKSLVSRFSGVVTTPLNRETRDLIGRKELAWMKDDAILINVGRGDVINQKALYDHLKSHPNFRAGIDTWWSEPADRGELELDFPFFELPNIIGSPHCADHVPQSTPGATRKALENVKRFLLGNNIRGVLDRNDYRK